MPKTNKKYVFLGRFSPVHKGHQIIIDKMIKKFGYNNILIVVGSSNSLTKRTPYTFSVRKRMIGSLYPGLKVVPLPDSSPNKEVFDEAGNKLWLSEIKNIENKFNAEFIFLGGSKKDLKILSEEFKTMVFVDRHKGPKISSTIVRELLSDGEKSKMLKFLDGKIVEIAIRNFKKI